MRRLFAAFCLTLSLVSMACKPQVMDKPFLVSVKSEIGLSGWVSLSVDDSTWVPAYGRSPHWAPTLPVSSVDAAGSTGPRTNYWRGDIQFKNGSVVATQNCALYDDQENRILIREYWNGNRLLPYVQC